MHFSATRAISVNQSVPGFEVEPKTDCICIKFKGRQFAIGAPLRNATVPGAPSPFRHLWERNGAPGAQ